MKARKAREDDLAHDEDPLMQPAQALANMSIEDFIRTLPAAIWAKDVYGRYLFMNTACSALLNLAPNAIKPGSRDVDFFTAEDAAGFHAKDMEIITTGRSEQFFESVHLPTGTKHLLTTKFALRDAQGESVAACGLCFEITESVNLLESLERSNDKLQLRVQQLLMLSRSPAIDAGDLPVSLKLIASAATVGLSVAKVSVWLRDGNGESLRCVHLQDRRLKAMNHDETRISRSEYPLYFAALDEERTIAANDACNDPHTAELAEGYLIPEGITSMLDTPIRQAGKTVGVPPAIQLREVHRHDSELRLTP